MRFLCSSGGVIFLSEEACVSQRLMKVAGDQVQTFQPNHPEKSVREVAIRRRSEWLYVIKMSLLCLHEPGRSVQRQVGAGVGSG